MQTRELFNLSRSLPYWLHVFSMEHTHTRARNGAHKMMTADDGVEAMMLLTISLQYSLFTKTPNKTEYTDTLDQMCRTQRCTCCFWVLEHTDKSIYIPVARMGAFTPLMCW